MPAPKTPFMALVLRRARRDARLSQRALAKRAGVPVSTLSQAETASRDLMVDAAQALLSVCGWSLQVVDGRGAKVDTLPLVDEGPLDAAGRRYPAHVELRSTERFGSWWGDRWGPYWGRPPRPPRTFDLPRRPYADAVIHTEVRQEMQDVQRVLRVAAYAVVTDSADRVLLARLTGRTSRPGWWTLPGGGLDHGEHPEAAVVREVREETGLDVTVDRLLGVDSEHLTAADGWDCDLHAVRVVYRAAAEDECKPLVHEADGTTDLARWVPRDELPSLEVVDLVRLALGMAP